MQIYGIMPMGMNTGAKRNINPNFKAKSIVTREMIGTCENLAEIVPKSIKAQVIKADSEKILGKLKTYMRTLPKGAKIVDRLIETETSGVVSFTLDRTLNNGLNKATYRTHTEKANIDYYRNIDLYFDDKGVLKMADSVMDYSGHSVHFERDERNIRRLILNGTEYRPVKDSTTWEPISSKGALSKEVISSITSNSLANATAFECLLDKYMQKDAKLF